MTYYCSLHSPQEGPPHLSEWNSLLAPGLVIVRGPFQGIPLLQSDGDAPQGLPSLQSEWDSLLGRLLLKNEWESPQGALPLQSQGDSPQGASPLHSEWDSLPGSPLHQSEGNSLRGIPPLPNDNVLLRGILLHLEINTHPVLRLVRTHMRDPHRGLRLPIHLHLPEKIRKLKRHLCQPQLRP